MQKTEFLERLRQKLSILPQREIDETLEYYSEMIDEYIESGCTPAEAVAKMGSVESVAAQILANAQSPANGAPYVQKQKKGGNMTVLSLILGFPLWFPLLITAFCLLLTVAIVIATLAMVVPWSLVVAFGASAVGLLIGTGIIFVGEGIGAAVLVLGSAFVLAALAIFSLWAALRLTVLGARASAAMFRGFFKLIFGRR